MSVTVRRHVSAVDRLVPLCIALEPFAQCGNHLCQPVMGHPSDPTGVKNCSDCVLTNTSLVPVR